MCNFSVNWCDKLFFLHLYEGRSISSRTISFKKTTVASRKTFLPLFNRMSVGKFTQRSQRFTSRHDASGIEISVSDAEEVQNACC